MSSLQQVYLYFENMLRERFQREIETNEDSIRYIFFNGCLTYLQINPNDIILEYPHTYVEKAKLDTYIPSKKSQMGFAFEFKFDRKNPDSKNSPKPRQAGKIFSDIFKLNLFNEDDILKFLVYITDVEMHSYFNNKENRLFDFYNLKINNEIVIDEKYIMNKSKTFVKYTGSYVRTIRVKSSYDSKIGDNYWMKIYQII